MSLVRSRRTPFAPDRPSKILLARAGRWVGGDPPCLSFLLPSFLSHPYLGCVFSFFLSFFTQIHSGWKANESHLTGRVQSIGAGGPPLGAPFRLAARSAHLSAPSTSLPLTWPVMMKRCHPANQAGQGKQASKQGREGGQRKVRERDFRQYQLSTVTTEHCLEEESKSEETTSARRPLPCVVRGKEFTRETPAQRVKSLEHLLLAARA